MFFGCLCFLKRGDGVLPGLVATEGAVPSHVRVSFACDVPVSHTHRRYIRSVAGSHKWFGTSVLQGLQTKRTESNSSSSTCSPALHRPRERKKNEQQSITPFFAENGVWPISAPLKAFLGILHSHRHSRPQLAPHAHMN